MSARWFSGMLLSKYTRKASLLALPGKTFTCEREIDDAGFSHSLTKSNNLQKIHILFIILWSYIVLPTVS